MDASAPPTRHRRGARATRDCVRGHCERRPTARPPPPPALFPSTSVAWKLRHGIVTLQKTCAADESGRPADAISVSERTLQMEERRRRVGGAVDGGCRRERRGAAGRKRRSKERRRCSPSLSFSVEHEHTRASPEAPSVAHDDFGSPRRRGFARGAGRPRKVLPWWGGAARTTSRSRRRPSNRTGGTDAHGRARARDGSAKRSE